MFTPWSFKNRLFTFIFGNPERKKWSLDLYNTLNESAHTDPKAVKITILDEAICLGMVDDRSFLISTTTNFCDSNIVYNPNMPAIFFMNVWNVYRAYEQDPDYGLDFDSDVKQTVPPIRMIYFYNGGKDDADLQTLDIQDAFRGKEKADINLKVKMFNINYGNNTDLLNSCPPLMEYSLFIRQLRDLYTADPNIAMAAAVSAAIDKMPEDSLLKPLLSEHKAEVTKMCVMEHEEYQVMTEERDIEEFLPKD